MPGGNPYRDPRTGQFTSKGALMNQLCGLLASADQPRGARTAVRRSKTVHGYDSTAQQRSTRVVGGR